MTEEELLLQIITVIDSNIILYNKVTDEHENNIQ